MDEIVSLGYWLRRRRKALDLTQDELARRVGVAEVTLRKLEADERRPSNEIAQRLADALLLAPDERATFLQVARGERWAGELPVPLQPPSNGPRLQTAPPLPATTIRHARPEPTALPTGTITLLFTDLEGSTQLVQRLGERYGDVLAEYRHLVALRLRGGRWLRGGHAG